METVDSNDGLKPPKKSILHNPHDKALFHALKNHKVARDAMRAYLPKEILSLANLFKREIT